VARRIWYAGYWQRPLGKGAGPGAAKKVLHGSHQEIPPINVSIFLPAPAGSVMGYESLGFFGSDDLEIKN